MALPVEKELKLYILIVIKVSKRAEEGKRRNDRVPGLDPHLARQALQRLGDIMPRLTGKVAVVTGGNSGIGLATAKRFHEQGAKVVISGRDQKTLDEAVKTIGDDVLAVRRDVSKRGDLDKLYKIVAEKAGKIDVLFANAGIAKFAPDRYHTGAVCSDFF